MSGMTAVAMSGGLDSSVTAWLLAREAQEGQSVIGLSMLLWDHSGVEANGRCCGALDLGDARRFGEDDRSVSGHEHVVPVGEDRRLAPDDRADQGAGHG